jgi:uncharacterized membrane protein
VSQDRPGWSDEQVERVIGSLLRVGVLLSAAVVLAGGIIYLVRHGSDAVGHHFFQGEPAELRSFPGIVEEALTLSGRGVIQLGLLVLIATPVARVVLAAFAFARQRDFTYVAVTLAVLAVLLYSLFAVGP